VGWTTGTTSSVTWAGGTTATETYSAGAVSSVTYADGTTTSKTYSGLSTAEWAWGQVSSQPEATDSGIDFEFQFHEVYPMIFSADRPLYFASSLSEGNP